MDDGRLKPGITASDNVLRPVIADENGAAGVDVRPTTRLDEDSSVRLRESALT
jgi:hypothetical protein